MVDPVSAAVFTAVKAQPTKNSGARESRPPASLTNVSISRDKSLSQLLSLAKQLAEQGPPVDYQKIAHIRNAIAEGTYKVDPEAVADAMLDFVAKEQK